MFRRQPLSWWTGHVVAGQALGKAPYPPLRCNGDQPTSRNVGGLDDFSPGMLAEPESSVLLPVICGLYEFRPSALVAQRGAR
jgi:hypothetical protein